MGIIPPRFYFLHIRKLYSMVKHHLLDFYYQKEVEIMAKFINELLILFLSKSAIFSIKHIHFFTLFLADIQKQQVDKFLAEESLLKEVFPFIFLVFKIEHSQEPILLTEFEHQALFSMKTRLDHVLN
jgi:hypothetical protein